MSFGVKIMNNKEFSASAGIDKSIYVWDILIIEPTRFCQGIIIGLRRFYLQMMKIVFIF